MMGPRQEAQAALFYEFSIEDHVPQDHMLRTIDWFVDLTDIRLHLAAFYSSTGRPSVDPELMIRMLLAGYCMGIRSERRLCEEVHLNLAYRWFCRLDLGDAVPDHSIFSKNRHGRFRDSDLLRHVFETVVARCINEGLVSGQRLAVDASLIEADTNRQNSTSKEEREPDKINPEDAPRAVREYLATLDEAAFGAATIVQPKFTSHSDPAAQWTAARKGKDLGLRFDNDNVKPNAEPIGESSSQTILPTDNINFVKSALSPARHVFVVDDDPQVSSYLMKSLTANGFNATGYANTVEVEAALSVLQPGGPSMGSRSQFQKLYQEMAHNKRALRLQNQVNLYTNLVLFK